MGVKNLWSVLTPYAEQKPMCELRGKTVAIDLAGWVCESLNVVDYFVHPRHHLKNLFFRTCFLIWEEVTPIFVLEGVAPKLKSQVIAKRNELQFRGVKPKEKSATQCQTQTATQEVAKEKGRTRFNHVLKQCETLLKSMGIQCVQGPGEAEAYCAFLNKKGLVDGIISQDSDCFAYGALRVYRNFSISTQGAHAAQGGSVDIYDMLYICQKMDFGQNKIIVMALLCGCDYCPDGVGGVGRDSVLKLFNKYEDKEILQRIRKWRCEDDKYTAMEMRVDDKMICSNCGHIGRTQSHTKSGCGVCRTHRGCDETLWKEERLSLKAELALRRKALVDPEFPSDDIIQEFLTEPPTIPDLNLTWDQPNIVKFIKQSGKLLQWHEIYCFQKFFPILTRWQVRNAQRLRQNSSLAYVTPKQIIKKRTLKGVPSLEVVWQDEKGFFKGLIPDDQLEQFVVEHPKGIDELWCTVEPLSLLEEAYPIIVATFIKSKEKPIKIKKSNKTKQKTIPLDSLENFNDMKVAANEIAKASKAKRGPKSKPTTQGLQPIDKFFKQKLIQNIEKNTPIKFNAALTNQCSTPIRKCLPTDFESDLDDAAFDLSDIVSNIVKKKSQLDLFKYGGRILQYEPVTKDLSLLLKEQSLDDMDLMAQKRILTLSAKRNTEPVSKRIQAFDDSFDVLINKGNFKIKSLLERAENITETTSILNTHVSRFMERNSLSTTTKSIVNDIDDELAEKENNNMSYFFNTNNSYKNDDDDDDAFEKFIEKSFKLLSKLSDKDKSDGDGETDEDDDIECVVISDDSE